MEKITKEELKKVMDNLGLSDVEEVKPQQGIPDINTAKTIVADMVKTTVGKIRKEREKPKAV